MHIASIGAALTCLRMSSVRCTVTGPTPKFSFPNDPSNLDVLRNGTVEGIVHTQPELGASTLQNEAWDSHDALSAPVSRCVDACAGVIHLVASSTWFLSI